ncbi:hypothetical protein BKA57DRAFT_443589 [Linnemannia elongata]|nr:hypothetical protein BKA57DRAFT_443589 [Linnemannia elongata]
MTRSTSAKYLQGKNKKVADGRGDSSIVKTPKRSLSVSQLISKRKLLTEPKVRYFGKHIVEDVRVIHRSNVTHCILNPEIMLVSEGMVLMIPGFESSIHESLRFTDSRFIGSVGFTGSEVFKKEGHTTGMVVFSIGNIMYIRFKQAAHHYKRNEESGEVNLYGGLKCGRSRCLAFHVRQGRK